MVRFGIGFCMAAALACGIAAADTPDQIIAARQEGYKHMGELMKEMHQAIQSGADVTQFAPKAQEIADWGQKLQTLFPPGTETGHKTHAKPEIWSDRAGFDKDAQNLSAQAGKLQQVAASGDKDAFAAQWKATGGACGACHRDYRYRLD